MGYKNITSNRIITPEHLILLCQWLKDLNSGEIVETNGYSSHYLGFDRISQKELDELCQLANTYLCDYMNGYFISNAMGEILPCKLKTQNKNETKAVFLFDPSQRGN